MSTRGLIGFVHNGEVKAFYNHFDSYLLGQGQNIVEFCNQVEDWNSFIKQYTAITWGDKNITSLIDPPQGVEMLRAISQGQVTQLCNDIDFAENTLFCEYAYLLNFDTKELEVYSSNYLTEQDQAKALLPLNLLATHSLYDIPSQWMDEIDMQKIEINHDWEDFYRIQGIDTDESQL